jgi:hypothetical protein
MHSMKLCGHCKVAKDESEFFHSSKYSDGLQHWCKECQRQARSGREVHRNHGGSQTPLYRHWKSMRWRCSPANQRHRKWYFDRGIGVCSEWDVWETFRVWALANGYVDGLTLDRVDNDQGYAPGNCQWITLSENVRKARRESGRR